MGRTIKRVALDFAAPLDHPWRGYFCPYQGQKCRDCDGQGYNPATRELANTFYGHNGDESRRWCDKVTQDEVDGLVSRGRLGTWNSAERCWEPLPRLADEVNELNRRGGLDAHDAINRLILVEFRARRLGVYGLCEVCGGHGDIYCDDKYRKLADEWVGIEPPSGEGWQLWQTVSDGPLSPVFATPDELVDWMCQPVPTEKQERGEGPYPQHPWAQGWKREVAEPFVKGTGWSPSMVLDGGELMPGVEYVARKHSRA